MSYLHLKGTKDHDRDHVRDFSGKVVLITGSSSGIGAVTAVEFSKCGAEVVITGRNAQKLTQVGKRCSTVSPNGLKPLEVVADIGKDEDCKRLIDSTIGSFGKLDILVNNASYGITNSIEDTDILEKYDNNMNINLRSVIYLTHLSVEHLEKTKGNIINISSIAGLKPALQVMIYCMTKCALDMFSKCLALELGPKGIRVNVINPAGVRTNFGAAMGIDEQTMDAIMDASAKSYPLRRIGQSIDIANAILFLASDESSFVTGINFIADGGALNGAVPDE